MRSMRGKKTAAVGAVSAVALLAAACGEAPGEDEETVDADFFGCMVTDVGGPDDRSFNASAWLGMEAAADETDGAIEVDFTESDSEDQYDPNLQQYADGDCDFILAVGGLMSDAVEEIAPEYPDTRFGIVDAHVDLDNVYSMEFNAAESSFLAGYLAAGMSETGVVATYGGLEIQPVTIFMDGFVEGVEYYNDENDDDVEALGWDVDSRNGSFTGNFDASDDGLAQTETFISQDADVIFPVAGGTGVGTPTETAEHEGIYTIWVDVDGRDNLPSFEDEFLSTSVKNIPDAVQDALVEARDEGPMDGRSVGTLENGGVSLAPMHGDVPDELEAEITEVEQLIVDGEIEIVSPEQPAPE